MGFWKKVFSPATSVESVTVSQSERGRWRWTAYSARPTVTKPGKCLAVSPTSWKTQDLAKERAEEVFPTASIVVIPPPPPVVMKKV